MWLTPVNGNDIRKRTALFARRIIRLCKALPAATASQTIRKQLLRSGTSVGAQVVEASFAKSRADFVSKLEGALQESEETSYWLTLVTEADIFRRSRVEDILKESKEITAILASIVSKSRLGGTDRR